MFGSGIRELDVQLKLEMIEAKGASYFLGIETIISNHARFLRRCLSLK